MRTGLARYSIATGCCRPAEVQQRAGREEFLQRAGIDRRRHDNDLQIGPRRLLKSKRAGERDVAVKMPLVKFVEQDRG